MSSTILKLRMKSKKTKKNGKRRKNKKYKMICLTLPLPQRTSVPMKATHFWLVTPLPSRAAIVLGMGCVSPVKLDSSMAKSTA